MEIVSLTERAQQHALRLKKSAPTIRDGMRIKVVGGGCSGLQYKLGFDDITEMDHAHEYPNGLIVMVDPKSAVLLTGATLDYHDELDRSGFEVSNPNATGGCGCGKSFSG